MFRRQLRICSLALIAVLICSVSAYCQSAFLTNETGSNMTTIGIGPNSSIVLIAGGDLLAVDGLDFGVNTLSTDGNNAPQVVNISGLGIFSGASTVFTPAPSPNSDATALLSIPNSTPFIDDAPVAEVFFDTSGLSDGDTFAYGITGDFLNDNERFETINVLTFLATVEAVPEPSSAGLLFALGSTLMMRRRRV